ncbi:hypothetical protein HYPSUDRAFT_57997 [Hypholoma sublateritium FD-334 SS-4]|uniref:Uncharacterized protein n=1 Tax=Hypholoma sublateritium (strain FD-334 SS-4) TaxID=945553 RepID=A0A0D2KQC6_HYPSF|nr:hypothetical protein HYPSUDRAFT_57997 [Hypholoma sublateritium FD-334 SS-4]
MGYNSTWINKQPKAKLYEIVDAHAGQVDWPTAMGVYDKTAGKPPLDTLRRVLRGNYGYSPEKVKVEGLMEETHPQDDAVQQEHGSGNGAHNIVQGALFEMPVVPPVLDAPDAPAPAPRQVDNYIANVMDPFFDFEGIEEGSSVGSDGDSDYHPAPITPTRENEDFNRVDADLDRLSLLRMTPEQDIHYINRRPSESVTLLSPAETEAFDLQLLQDFANANPQRSRAMRLHREFKGRRCASNHEMICRWALALEFYDEVTAIDVWEDRNNGGVIPMKTINKFLDRSSAWISQIRPAVRLNAKHGPSSPDPHPEVVAVLNRPLMSGTALQRELKPWYIL